MLRKQIIIQVGFSVILA